MKYTSTLALSSIGLASVQGQQTAIVIDEANIQKAQMAGMQFAGKVDNAFMTPEGQQVAEEIHTQVDVAETRVEMSLNKLFQPILAEIKLELDTFNVPATCDVEKLLQCQINADSLADDDAW